MSRMLAERRLRKVLCEKQPQNGNCDNNNTTTTTAEKPLNAAPSDKPFSAERIAHILSTVARGWYQVNNAIIPYLVNSGRRYVPKSVIEYICKCEFTEDFVSCTDDEVILFNAMVAEAAITIQFDHATTKIAFDIVKELNYNLYYVSELPNDRPLQHATAQTLPDVYSSQTVHPPSHELRARAERLRLAATGVNQVRR